jgi:ketosteroid isomerase-like protein
MSAEQEIQSASKQFYAALTRMAAGDAAALADIWSHGATVTTMHPIGGREVGWGAVKSAFEKVAELASGGKVDLVDQLITVDGDVAYEVGVERGQLELAGQQVAIDQRVTNIYRREGDTWKMIHHHTDLSPGMQEILSRL